MTSDNSQPASGNNAGRQPLELDINWPAAKQFLDLLGKNGDVRLRAFPHKATPPDVKKRLRARKFGRSKEDVEKAQRDGLGIYVVINKGGDDKASITHCIAYFAEFDGTDEAEQLQRVAISGLPEASIIVRTQGGSLHFYWLTTEPITDKALWQADMKRLAAHLGSDKSVNDPSRVMRLPGCLYMDGNQQPVGPVEIIHIGEGRYTREDITSAFPTEATLPLPTHPLQPSTQHPDRTAERALEQLGRIPSRTPGENTREAYLNLLWGLTYILGPEQAGHAMAAHSPAWAAEEDLIAKANEANGSITDATFFEVARAEWGITSPKHDSPFHSAPPAKPAGVAQGDGFQDDDENADIDRELSREAHERYLKAQEATVDLNEVFGPIWGQLLIDRAAAFPCDPSMLLLPMLCFIASLVGTKASVKVKTGWLEALIVWGLIAQPASSLKSPAGGVFGKPLAKLQGAAHRHHDKLLSTFEIKERKWKADCRRIETAAKKDGTTPELPDPPQAPPKPRQYFVDSITIECLAAFQSQDNVPGILAFHDELADWFSSFERNSKSTDRAKWLKLWNGGPLKHDTATSVKAFAESSAISIFGFIQPDKLAALHAAENKSDEDSSGDGLWARFLPLIPRTIPFSFNDLEVDITDDLMRLAAQLDEVPNETTLFIHPAAIRDVLSPSWERWVALENESGGSRSAFIGKLRGYSVRLAGLLHLLHERLDNTIAMPTAITAVRLCDFFLAQFDLLAPQITSKEDVATPTAKFLAKVHDRNLQEVRVRDLQRWAILGRKTSSRECHSFLEGLAAQGIGTFALLHTKGSKAGAWAWKPNR
jgi:hypothetical protein